MHNGVVRVAGERRGFSAVEVLFASACFCACLTPLLSMGKTNQSASHQRLMRIKIRDAAELIMDCLATLPVPLVQTLPADPAPPPPPLALILMALTGNGLPPPPAGALPPPTGLSAPPPPGANGVPPPPPPGAGLPDPNNILADIAGPPGALPPAGGDGFHLKIGINRNVGGKAHLSCFIVVIESQRKPGVIVSYELRRLVCE